MNILLPLIFCAGLGIGYFMRHKRPQKNKSVFPLKKAALLIRIVAGNWNQELDKNFSKELSRLLVAMFDRGMAKGSGNRDAVILEYRKMVDRQSSMLLKEAAIWDARQKTWTAERDLLVKLWRRTKVFMNEIEVHPKSVAGQDVIGCLKALEMTGSK